MGKQNFSMAMEKLSPYLAPGALIADEGGIPTHHIPKFTPGMQANSYYFSHPKWAKIWFDFVHRYPEFQERWTAVAGTWDNKVVVDIGCGPGNVYASLGGSPALLIGVDLARGALEMAQEHGYTPLLADAHNIPFIAGFADIVAINATLHHCDDMGQVLAEGGRLIRPGGILVTDHDPQHTALAFKGFGLFLWNIRRPLYRWLDRAGHSRKDDEQTWALATELHHKPGDGVTPDLYERILRPLGFDITLYPHNTYVGAEILHSERGRAPFKIRLAQRLAGINPNCVEGAMSIMCVAKRRLLRKLG